MKWGVVAVGGSGQAGLREVVAGGGRQPGGVVVAVVNDDSVDAVLEALGTDRRHALAAGRRVFVIEYARDGQYDEEADDQREE
ncbi:MAG: hypothetical protein IH863_04340 [Chloroflexi bacterium]|nr:hypothetical protein [Chloroflexota bacterium]